MAYVPELEHIVPDFVAWVRKNHPSTFSPSNFSPTNKRSPESSAYEARKAWVQHMDLKMHSMGNVSINELLCKYEDSKIVDYSDISI